MRRSGRRWNRAYGAIRLSQIGAVLLISAGGLVLAVGGPAIQMPFAVIIAAAFAVNIVAELTVLSLKLKSRTEARRIAAEVIDSEVWQFCLRVPAAYNTDDEVAALNLRESIPQRLSMLLDELPSDAFDGLGPTKAMTDLRGANPGERHERYLAERVRAIAHKSGRDSRRAESSAVIAQVMILTLLLAGAVVAIMRVSGQLQVNLVGLFLAGAGAVTGWFQFRGFANAETAAKSDSAFFQKAAAQAERFGMDSDAWYDVVRRIEARAAPSELS